ncbi:pyrimidine dimer DNA glycosylase/endonuclease V [Nesterenkonia sp. NBAIMH1]|uniref:pyrimidine dimer DNA glycosylase/endonuclease V n=1 Tax=Nesterenkonia sp. NBAIMH1 TaxID=2600320 RepID=UPI0011B61BB4|nr:pyrimidine dimer DNA glycosylase/endonuclease V [Nesterenkonia sp. NBAIMH1]
MRLWSLHPAALDRQGLIASWREALLAQAVLLGRTRGYTRHPQLHRFREHPEPVQAIVAFLHGVREEAVVRGYRFDAGRIAEPPESAAAGIDPSPIEVTAGQLDLEWQHLRAKIAARSPERLEAADALVAGPVGAGREHPPAHPLFTVVPGGPADWERA